MSSDGLLIIRELPLAQTPGFVKGDLIEYDFSPPRTEEERKCRGGAHNADKNASVWWGRYHVTKDDLKKKKGGLSLWGVFRFKG